MIAEPQLVPVDEIAKDDPLMRLSDESPRWYLRYRNFALMGHTRSINAVWEAERKASGKPIRDKQQKTKTTVGPEWYNAAKRYKWKERAKAYDRAQDEHKAHLMREIAQRCAYTSRPFRLVQLNVMLDGLARVVEAGCEAHLYLAVCKQMQSLMQDIANEVQAWGITIDASSDAAALDAYQAKQARLAAHQQERDEAMKEREEEEEEAMDAALMQLILKNPQQYLPPGADVETVLAQLEGMRRHAI
jgi:hypothetical protein